MRINNKRQSKIPDVNVSEEPPLQGAEFKHVAVLLPSEGRKEADTHRWIGAAVASACRGEEGAEPQGKALDFLVLPSCPHLWS